MAEGSVVTVRFGDEQLLVLDEYARLRGVRRSTYVRWAVEVALASQAVEMAQQAGVLASDPPVVIHGEPAALEEPPSLVPLSSAPLGVPDPPYEPPAGDGTWADVVGQSAFDAFRAEKIRALRASISEAEAAGAKAVAKLVEPKVRAAATVVRAGRELPPGYEMVNGRPVWAGEVDADGWPMGTEPA